MLALSWVGGLLRRRPLRLVGAAAGIALAVALLGSLGAFLGAAKADMTRRAVTGVGVDWQVEAQPGADPTAVLAATRADAHVSTAVPVPFADTAGLQATIGATTQSTGPGQVLGLPPGYARLFPAEIRVLAGRAEGVLLVQQTAANLHAAPGDTVDIGRAGQAPARVRVTGVVDLPQADSLFQKVGAPPGAQPLAPPDNVVLLPEHDWHTLFDTLAADRPEHVRFQVHARLRRRLPHDPAAAFGAATGAARHLEAQLAGSGLVGDNLAAALDAARSDALYAQILFVVLGLPGAVLAGLLTRAVATAGAARRRREFALLRARGASAATVQRLSAAEAAAVAIVGCLVGLAAALAVGRVAFGSATFGGTRLAGLVWAATSVGVGTVIAVLTVALPARRQARALSVSSARASVGRAQRPAALRFGADLWLLSSAALVFWATSRAGYKLVLAPEGVPTVSVSYWSLAGPLLLWIGAGLVAWRAADTILGPGAPLLRRLLRPVAHNLSAPVTATLTRRRRTLGGATVLVALSIAFAASTAVFNATYRHQVAPDHRRRRRGHRAPGRPPRRLGRDVAGAHSGGATRRSPRAPLRVCRRRPPGSLRRRPPHHHPRDPSAGRLLRRRRRPPAHGHPGPPA